MCILILSWFIYPAAFVTAIHSKQVIVNYDIYGPTYILKTAKYVKMLLFKWYVYVEDFV